METSTIKWHFLPELPKNTDEVLIAVQYDDMPIQGYYSKGKWKGSVKVTEQMNDGYVNDNTFSGTEFIYAWAEMPKMPKVPENFNPLER